MKIPGLQNLTAIAASAALVSALALPAPAFADNDTLRKLLLIGAAAFVIKTVIEHQQGQTLSSPVRSSSGLDQAEVTGVQFKLRQAGYYDGRVDGIWGAQTRQAVIAWQRVHGYRADGVLTSAQLARLELVYDAAPRFGSLSTAGSSITGSTLPDRNPYYGAALTRAQLSNLQSDLQFLGYYDGAVDGVWGPVSQAALADFRRDQPGTGGYTSVNAAPGTLDLASVTVSAQEREQQIAADLEQRLARSGN